MSESGSPSFNVEKRMEQIEHFREQVLKSDNTAQQEFLTFLDNLDPLSTEIDCDQYLSGDIDCSILEKCNFKGITRIRFGPGQITSISGIPAGVTQFICADNYLYDMPELPDSVVEADVHENAIRSAGSFHDGLIELNISKNRIETLENLPATLINLMCDNNQLRLLNLSGVDNLRVLHCSNNPRLVIEGLPDTLVDFQMDNDVATQIRHASDDDSVVAADIANDKADYTECLYNYFEMKKKYEEGVLKMKRSVYASAKSKKAAKKRVGDIKPKCIECARPVGTVFKNDGRTYVAHCGDVSKPCSLDIRLFAGEYGQISDMVGYYKRLTEIIKQQIMVDKLNVLFHYMSEKDGVETFKENLDFYTKENMHLTSLSKEYQALYFDEERNAKVDAKLKKIKDIQDRITEFLAKDAVSDAMTIYVEELMPEMENLQLLKYETRELLVDEVAELYQTPWRVQQLEYTFGEYPRVLKYNVKKHMG